MFIYIRISQIPKLPLKHCFKCKIKQPSKFKKYTRKFYTHLQTHFPLPLQIPHKSFRSNCVKIKRTSPQITQHVSRRFMHRLFFRLAFSNSWCDIFHSAPIRPPIFIGGLLNLRGLRESRRRTGVLLPRVSAYVTNSRACAVWQQNNKIWSNCWCRVWFEGNLWQYDERKYVSL